MAKKNMDDDRENIFDNINSFHDLLDDFEGYELPQDKYISDLGVTVKDLTIAKRCFPQMVGAFMQNKKIARTLARAYEEYDDEKAIELAHNFFKNMYQRVVTNSHKVYRARTAKGDTDEARAEQQRLERLDRELNEQQNTAFVEQTAETMWEALLEKVGPRKVAEAARRLQHDILEHAVLTIILATYAELPKNATAKNWNETLQRNLSLLNADGSHDYVYTSSIHRKAAMVLEHLLNPAEMSFEELRLWAGITWLEEQVSSSALAGVESVKLHGLLKLAADYTVLALAQYFGGKATPVGRDGELTRIPVQATRGQKRELAVGEVLPPELLKVVDPESVTPMLERIRREQNETKAKVFVGTLALACQQGVDPENFFVSLSDLMRLIAGYERTGTKKTNYAYYWATAAEIVTYLTLDLASTNVRILVKLPQYKQPLTVEEYLMHRPRPAFKQGPMQSQFIRRIVALTNQNEKEELATYIKNSGLEGFFLGLPEGILDAFGTRSGKGQPNAFERVSREVLQLKGPAFWLAYEIAFLRRWAPPVHATADKGKDLLETLKKHGYLEKSASRTGGRVSYKTALGSWFKDVNALIDINMLEDPGASIHELKKGRWHDVTQEVRGWLNARGRRVTQADLAELRVIYHLPQERIRQLAEPRAKREHYRKS